MSHLRDPEELTLLRTLATRYPTIDAALAEAAALRALLTLPKDVVHVISDVHGEYKKLRHVINNASGSLRPLVERIFSGKLSTDEQQQLLSLLYYPAEMMEYLRKDFRDIDRRRVWVRTTLRNQFEIVRTLSRTYRRRHVLSLIPSERQELFVELIAEPYTDRDQSYIDTMIDALTEHGRDLSAVREASRLVRNLSIAEIIVAGDLGDRGPRVDRVIDYLIQQPTISFTWGNHDVSWMGACLGQEALIALVLRMSLRYRHLSQLEEGYGLTMAPLEKLARTVYADDPAECFMTRGSGLRDNLLMARMQKAAAILQFKLDGQTSRRHPDWDMESRNLLHRIDSAHGTVQIDGRQFPLRDTHFPTLRGGDPYTLVAEEQECIDRLRESFIRSPRLWEHMSFVVKHGAMWLIRDHTLIFHACVPVDEKGGSLSLAVDGEPRSGRALFSALESVVRRAFRKGASDVGADADWFWYLWTGPRSPLFGKDRMTTFENYFVDDPQTHKETKNPYFHLMHEAEFCRGIAAEFGVREDALIVNGHVPVNVEKGEEPVKRGGNAITIDGAFSEAYGDRGYTLVLSPDRVFLAEHHHFDSVSDAITMGADIIPRVTTVRTYDDSRIVGDTEKGNVLRDQVRALERLITAYQEGLLLERGDPQP
ncbi:MAG: fructose-1,6-bisphosphatase [Ignavibacteria bacterium]|nr:fructose-1,6-bisphosphatase [Ignavibacteria bacterium]